MKRRKGSDDPQVWATMVMIIWTYTVLMIGVVIGMVAGWNSAP